MLNFYYADNSPAEKEATRALFLELRHEKHEAFISAAVLQEIARASEQKQQMLMSLVGEYGLQPLEIDDEAENLADLYVRNGIIPQKYRADAVHIAVAVINDLDVIVSWNFEHIVKLKTKRYVSSVNKIEGYKEIEIYSPLEVIES